ncbi:uncharacterized protein SCODWIG_02198 [Saccharomycodes ludwigii]|uniref:FHA domain-containing protein n=1 Tax=Saccharomycodes ludwigii TaxID=36035 RepID=A0A376B6V3_9ASCO|nr:hypothetical protein SCDLUD_003869 [Saccharomycodes ludwigii]KAH3899589.1 hypothetical protein SCDLUD_003869 [Saccharomycodes ludwigii]SSD60437.1 uncharacterized protein SCODWIG_02198 [Saccharomycodes ludwigii]
MTIHFPPSSPTMAYEEPVGKDNSIKNKYSTFSSATDNGSVIDFAGQSNDPLLYPTPNPSSSTGNANILVSPDSKTENLEERKGQEYYVNELKSSPTRPSPTSSDLALENELKKDLLAQEKKSSSPYNNVKFQVQEKGYPLIFIPIKPTDKQSLTIGRKSAICDVLLPKYKNVSRQHASITYYPITNKIKLKCLGCNGLCVVFPRKLNYDLVKNLADNVFELISTADIDLENGDVLVTDREIIKKRNLTSFIMKQNETCYMPFLPETVLDFGKVDAILTLVEDTEEDDDSDVTESDFSPFQLSAAKTVDEISVENDNSTKLKQSPVTPIVVTDIQPIFETPTRNGIYSQKKILKEVNTQLPFEQKELTLSIIKNPPHTPLKQNETNDGNDIDIQSPIKHKPIEEQQNKKRAQSEDHGKDSKKNIKKLKLTKDEIIFQLRAKSVNIEDLKRCLINHLAFATIQQVPLSVLAPVNSTTQKMSKSELRAVLQTCECLGVINRVGKDAAGKPLEEEYFYELEKDDDEERKNLIRSLKGGRAGLRSCRRTHKQYFWKKPKK